MKSGDIEEEENTSEMSSDIREARPSRANTEEVLKGEKLQERVKESEDGADQVEEANKCTSKEGGEVSKGMAKELKELREWREWLKATETALVK